MGESGAPKKPSKFILGLPIPGAAGILVSLVVANHAVAGGLPGMRYLVAGVVAGLAFFMVSSIKFRSFKDLKLSWRTVTFVALAIGSSAVIAVRFHISFALVWLLGSYIVIGLVEALFNLSRRGLRRRRASRMLPDDDDEAEDAEPETSQS